MKLEKRTILVTGGTSGIGLELAKQLFQRGNTVIVTGRDQEKLDTANKVLRGVHTFRSDVSDPGEIAALHDRLGLSYRWRAAGEEPGRGRMLRVQTPGAIHVTVDTAKTSGRAGQP